MNFLDVLCVLIDLVQHSYYYLGMSDGVATTIEHLRQLECALSLWECN
jgi:hypothetical protein